MKCSRLWVIWSLQWVVTLTIFLHRLWIIANGSYQNPFARDLTAPQLRVSSFPCPSLAVWQQDGCKELSQTCHFFSSVAKAFELLVLNVLIVYSPFFRSIIQRINMVSWLVDPFLTTYWFPKIIIYLLLRKVLRWMRHSLTYQRHLNELITQFFRQSSKDVE